MRDVRLILQIIVPVWAPLSFSRRALASYCSENEPADPPETLHNWLRTFQAKVAPLDGSLSRLPALSEVAAAPLWSLLAFAIAFVPCDCPWKSGAVARGGVVLGGRRA
ncbi:MAG TPA: hypothetical protein VKS22_02645, partial [Candidatus Binataceae bacterium]|nr:hypothetical protein [Candidatus Binataceae bacterium]